MLGFYYTIEYNPCRENIIAVALSRSLGESQSTLQESSILALSASLCGLLDDIKKENDISPKHHI